MKTVREILKERPYSLNEIDLKPLENRPCFWKDNWVYLYTIGEEKSFGGVNIELKKIKVSEDCPDADGFEIDFEYKNGTVFLNHPKNNVLFYRFGGCNKVRSEIICSFKIKESRSVVGQRNGRSFYYRKKEKCLIFHSKGKQTDFGLYTNDGFVQWHSIDNIKQISFYRQELEI